PAPTLVLFPSSAYCALPAVLSSPARRSSDLSPRRRATFERGQVSPEAHGQPRQQQNCAAQNQRLQPLHRSPAGLPRERSAASRSDRKSTRLNSSHVKISYAVYCSNKKTPS